MSVMLSHGADGLITNQPTVARRVLQFRDTLGPIGRLLVWVAGETGLLRGADESSEEGDA